MAECVDSRVFEKLRVARTLWKIQLTLLRLSAVGCGAGCADWLQGNQGPHHPQGPRSRALELHVRAQQQLRCRERTVGPANPVGNGGYIPTIVIVIFKL